MITPWVTISSIAGISVMLYLKGQCAIFIIVRFKVRKLVCKALMASFLLEQCYFTHHPCWYQALMILLFLQPCVYAGTCEGLEGLPPLHPHQNSCPTTVINRKKQPLLLQANMPQLLKKTKQSKTWKFAGNAKWKCWLKNKKEKELSLVTRTVSKLSAREQISAMDLHHTQGFLNTSVVSFYSNRFWTNKTKPFPRVEDLACMLCSAALSCS